MDNNFTTHYMLTKFRNLRKHLFVSEALSFCALLNWVCENTPQTGVLDGLCAADIESGAVANWDGKDKDFVFTLLENGYLDCNNGVYSVHNWLKDPIYAEYRKTLKDFIRKKCLKTLERYNYNEKQEINYLMRSERAEEERKNRNGRLQNN